MTKIAVYTPEIVGAILSDHPEIVDSWLKRLHEKYMAMKESCDFDRNPIACFNLPHFQQFEKHFQLWLEGGIITISVQPSVAFRIRNEKRGKRAPSGTLAKSADRRFMCSRCSATFADGEEYVRHRMHEIDAVKTKGRRRDESRKDVPPNPIWWLSYG